MQDSPVESHRTTLSLEGGKSVFGPNRIPIADLGSPVGISRLQVPAKLGNFLPQSLELFIQTALVGVEGASILAALEGGDYRTIVLDQRGLLVVRLKDGVYEH